MNIHEIARFRKRPILPKNEKDLVGIFHKIRDFPVEITASSIFSDKVNDDMRYPHAVIEYKNDAWWSSADSEASPQWIKFNLTQRRILIANYSVQSSDQPVNDNHAKQWVVEGYNNKNEWVTIDSVSVSKGNSPLYIETRPVINNESPFSAIKFTQTGKNWHGNDVFRFFKIDLFGIYEDFSPQIFTCKAFRRTPCTFIMFALLMYAKL